jgi:hypothetical protein
MTPEQIKQAEERYNQLKAITWANSESPEGAQAMEERCQMENEWFAVGYKFSSRGGGNFYLKAIDDEQ